MIDRIRQAASQPFALETCYLPAEEFARLAEAPLERASLFAILEKEYKITLAHADEEIDATAADARTAELLGVAKGEPLLRIRQVIYSTRGQALFYVHGLYRSDRYNLRIRRFRLERMVELVGIGPPSWIERMQLADSTMFSIGKKGQNAHSAVQNGTKF